MFLLERGTVSKREKRASLNSGLPILPVSHVNLKENLGLSRIKEGKKEGVISESSREEN